MISIWDAGMICSARCLILLFSIVTKCHSLILGFTLVAIARTAKPSLAVVKRMPNWLVGLQVYWSVGPAFGWYQADQPCDGGEDPKLPRSGEGDHVSQRHPSKSSDWFWLEVDILQYK